MSTLIIGLGNPGKNYEKNRHNAGFMALNFLAHFMGVSDWKENKKLKSLVAKIDPGFHRDDKNTIIFAKPMTFMNESGMAVAALAKYYKIKPENIIIVYDELDLPFGTLRVRNSGSAAGHNGLKSIIQHLGTDEFWRIRIGIKNELADLPANGLSRRRWQAGKIPAEKFVLSNFSAKELDKLKKEILPELVTKLTELIKT